MALVVADRIQETTSTAGTGTLTLAGAATGYQSFSTGIGNGNTTYYVIVDPIANVWEVGLGTVGAGTLSRDTVLANSSGTTSKITLAGNTSNVWCDYPAGKAVIKAADDSVTVPEIVASNGLLIHSNTVSTSFTVPSNSNIISAGPITVASGATVTLPSGGVWTIV